MSKFVGLAGIIVAGLTAVLFIADLAAGIPFQRVSIAVDTGFILGSLILAYLGWSVMERSRKT